MTATKNFERVRKASISEAINRITMAKSRSISEQLQQIREDLAKKHQICLEKIAEEAGTSSSGRVRLKDFVESEQRARQALERQLRDFKSQTSRHEAAAKQERLTLRNNLDLVESARAALENRINVAETEIKALKVYTGMPAMFRPGTKSPSKSKVQGKITSLKK